jgi:very-short-patch-repair endonuclease
VVETDSYEYHQGSIAFEDDHQRDLALRRRGLTVLRYTGRQLEREPATIAAEIRERLA